MLNNLEISLLYMGENLRIICNSKDLPLTIVVSCN